MCACECRCQQRPEEGCQIPLGLKLRAVVNCLTWVLGSKLKFSGKAVSFLNLLDISPALGSVDSNTPMNS